MRNKPIYTKQEVIGALLMALCSYSGNISSDEVTDIIETCLCASNRDLLHNYREYDAIAHKKL